jgi:dihydropteroate synthase
MNGATKPDVFRAGAFCLPLGRRTLVMGIINVTPDSFSDGGAFVTVDAALRQADSLLASGADILDIGGESTRPGSSPVGAAEEIRRVVPVLEALAARFACPLSVDTSKPEVARAALDAGAAIVNDVLGLQGDPAMAGVAARAGAGVVVMHNARLYRTADVPAADIVSAMRPFFERSLGIALQADLTPEQLVLDPGIGFGVSTRESLAMIDRLAELEVFNLPILVGPSRKRFIGDILQKPVEDRLMGTAAAVAVAIARGADLVRVHDVAGLSDAIALADAICRPAAGEETR